MLRAVESLRREVRELRREVLSLREEGERFSLLGGMLRRRGLESFRHDPARHLIFPPAFSPVEKQRFYGLFKKYSFRLFLREVLIRKGRFRVSEVVRFSTPETGKRYLRDLIEMGLADAAGDFQYRLTHDPPASLGPTLEWFMAEVLRREFACPALYGLRCRGGRFGGDYDTVALLEGQLLYLEAKSSPPKNIEGAEIRSFLGRLQELLPHLALFFVDTELRLKDKIVPFFETELRAMDRRGGENPPAVEKIGDEIFYAPPRIYILGSKRSVVKNLGTCFRHHFSASPPGPEGRGGGDTFRG